MSHGGSAGQGFPATRRTAVTHGSGGIQALVPGFRMRATGAAIKDAIEDHTYTNARADGDIKEAASALPGAPSCLSHGCGIGIIFKCHRQTSRSRKTPGQIASLPARQQIRVANHTADRVNRSSAADADALQWMAQAGQLARDALDGTRGR